VYRPIVARQVGVPGPLFDSVVIELKQDAVAAVVFNNWNKKTPLQQTSFSGNFLALMGSGTKPQRFTLRSALKFFLDFWFDTIRRRSAHLLDKVETRTHIVEGMLKASLCIDEDIGIIRTASD
jgi:DNA gyrase subunit A